MNGKNHGTLFERPIVRNGTLGLSEQLHDILCEEIHAGRWQIGDRLPSLGELAEQCGLSQKTIMNALEKLREEGYVRIEERRGTFLESVLPEGRSPLGAIGVVMLEEGEEESALAQGTRLPILHRVLEAASERNYISEVVYLKGERWRLADQTGGVFSDRVKGVISPFSFPRPDFQSPPSEKLPMVFITPYSRSSLPCVVGDTWLGALQLTRRVIAAGHRETVVCGCHLDKGSLSLSRFLEGHGHAMAEAGLSVNWEAVERSTATRFDDLAAICGFLEEFSQATAIVAMRSRTAQSLIAAADAMGMRVPEDVSVVSRGQRPMRPFETERLLTAYDYDVRQTVETAFEILFDLMRTGRSRWSRATVPPLQLEGHSLAPPRAARPAIFAEADSLEPLGAAGVEAPVRGIRS